MRLRDLLDPDTRLFSGDKLQHAAAFFVLAMLASTFLTPLPNLVLMLWTGVIYEAGQTDVAVSLHRTGQVGYGFGLLDLAADMVGASLWVGLHAAF